MEMEDIDIRLLNAFLESDIRSSRKKPMRREDFFGKHAINLIVLKGRAHIYMVFVSMVQK